MGLKKDIIESEFRVTGANKLHNEIGKTESEIQRLNKENEMLMVSKKKLEAQNKKGTKAWKQLNDQMKKNKQTILEEKKKLAELNSQLKITDMSARQLAKRKKELTRELNNTSQAINPKKWNSLNKELQKVDGQYKKVRSGSSGVNGVMKKMGALLPVVGFAALAAGAKRLVSNMIQVRKEFEKYEAMLKVALGSQQAARKEMRMLAQFAADTPFQLSNLTESYVKLVNQGFKPSRDEMRLMGDLAASMGKEFDQLTEAIIDAQTGEFERLKEFGIRASKQGDQVKFTFKGIETQVDFTADSIQQYILGLGNMEGITGSMAEISGTLGGRISNLGDAWDTLMNTMGSKSSGIMVRIINWTIDLVNGTNLALKSLKQIKEEVLDELTAENLKKGLQEIEVITQGLTKRGMEQAAAEKRAVELYTESIDFRIQETRKALDVADAADQEQLQRKLALLEGEKQALKDHFFEVAQLEQKQREAYLETYAKEQERKRVENLADVQSSFKEEENLLKQHLVNGEITLEQYDRRASEIKLKYLQKERDILRQAGEETLDIDKEILDLQINQMEQHASEKKRIEKQQIAERKQILNELQGELDTAYKQELGALKQKLRDGKISQEEYEDEMLALKLTYMQMELALREEYGMEYIDLQNQIMDMEIELRERHIARIKEQDMKVAESHEQLFDRLQGDIQRIASSIASMVNQRNEALASAKEIYEEDLLNLQKQLNEGSISYNEYVEKRMEASDRLYDSERKAQKRFQKESLLNLLKELKNILYIAIAEVWLKEVASKGYWGIITAAALTAVLEGAYALAASRISSGYSAGGPTGLGGKYEPAGIVHKNEYVIPEEGFFNPNLRPFINAIEEARKAGSLRSLTMAGTPVTQSASSGSSKGFAQGGPTSPMGPASPSTSDPQLTLLLVENLRLLKKLDSEGVFAYIGDKQMREIRNRTQMISDIESNVSR